MTTVLFILDDFVDRITGPLGVTSCRLFLVSGQFLGDDRCSFPIEKVPEDSSDSLGLGFVDNQIAFFIFIITQEIGGGDVWDSLRKAFCDSPAHVGTDGPTLLFHYRSNDHQDSFRLAIQGVDSLFVAVRLKG